MEETHRSVGGQEGEGVISAKEGQIRLLPTQQGLRI